MRTFLFLGILFVLCGKDSNAQTSTKVAPDCSVPFKFTAAGVRIPAAGYGAGSQQTGCVGWVLVYNSTGFSGVSLRLESAPDSSGAAGTWVAFSGSSVTLTGCGSTNPLTATTQGCLSINGYNPWVSVRLTSVTGSGSITGFLYGCRVDNCAALFTATAGGVTSNVNLTQVGGAAIALGQTTMSASLPVAIASDQSNVPENLVQIGGTAVTANTGNATAGTQRVVLASNQPAVQVQGQSAAGGAAVNNPVLIAGQDGGSLVRIPKVDSQGNQFQFLACTSSADVALSGTGLTEIVVGSGSLTVYICKVFITSVSGGNPVVNTFTISRATVSTCGSATQLFLAGGVTGIDSDFGGSLRSGAGQSICVSESVANSDKVTITFSQF